MEHISQMAHELGLPIVRMIDGTGGGGSGRKPLPAAPAVKRRLPSLFAPHSPAAAQFDVPRTRMLGATDDYGAMLGLDKEWAKRAIAASGNYGEIFAANIGEQTPIGLARGLNALWTQGGLMYAMPFR